jgi:release factor glutamine methyltransferase
MNPKAAITARLSPVFGEREAASLARIVHEDVPPNEWPSVVERLLLGEPLQYIIGKADFYGLSVFVDENVLIPRPETEELVDWVLHDFWGKPLRLLDIGTGSGCIALALAKQRPTWEIWGVDLSAGALAIAQKNAAQLNVEPRFLQCDILDERQWAILPDAFDLICSNPPYIPLSEWVLMPSQVLDHEPHLALFVEDADPLQFYRAIGRFAASKLAPQGRLYVEINEHYGAATRRLFEDVGFGEVELRQDMSQKDRMLMAVKNA